jgi:hypothetical protein
VSLRDLRDILKSWSSFEDAGMNWLVLGRSCQLRIDLLFDISSCSFPCC